MHQTPILPDEQRIIDAAREIGALAELCDLVDYYTDIGGVPEHWRAKYKVLALVRRLNSLAEGRTGKAPMEKAPVTAQ
jgi:hypothetical protein